MELQSPQHNSQMLQLWCHNDNANTCICARRCSSCCKVRTALELPATLDPGWQNLPASMWVFKWGPTVPSLLGQNLCWLLDATCIIMFQCTTVTCLPTLCVAVIPDQSPVKVCQTHLALFVTTQQGCKQFRIGQQLQRCLASCCGLKQHVMTTCILIAQGTITC